MDKKITTIDDYIAVYPEDVQAILKKIRAIIHEEAPEASEKISYGIPTFHLKENLVHFAGYKNHIGFYPTSSGIEKFKDVLINYKTSRGTVQFSLKSEIPYDLIREMVRVRVNEVKSK